MSAGGDGSWWYGSVRDKSKKAGFRRTKSAAFFGIGEDSGQESPVFVCVPSLLLVVGVEVCLGVGSGFYVSVIGRCVEVVVA